MSEKDSDTADDVEAHGHASAEPAPAAPEPSEEPRLFVEHDDGATAMGYDQGKVPLYVVAAWAVLLISYAIYMVSLALPDLSAWGSP